MLERLSLPDTQFSSRPGILELGSGQPDPTLLPTEGLKLAIDLAFRTSASSALAYGAEPGPGCLLSQLAEWLSVRDRVDVDPSQLFVTAGASQGLDLLCGLLTKPGDTALVEAPVYHLALCILRDRGLRLVAVPTDDEGLRIDLLETVLAGLERNGSAARILYTVPTFSNPTGRSHSLSRKQALAALAERHGLIVIEDDVYRSLWYDAPPGASLYDLSAPGSVVRLASFSKILAPGLRLGWIQAAPAQVRELAVRGMLDSGGGLNHFTAHMVAAYMELNLIDAHIDELRSAYRVRRDALLASLERHLPDACHWERPGGGFFVWLRLPQGCDSSELLREAEAADVSYVPGDRFHAESGCRRFARLAFCQLTPMELEEAAKRLGCVVASALR